MTFDEKKMSMTSTYNQSKHWKFHLAIGFLTLFQQDGVDVAFKMIDSDERFLNGVGERFGVTQTNQQ